MAHDCLPCRQQRATTCFRDALCPADALDIKPASGRELHRHPCGKRTSTNGAKTLTLGRLLSVCALNQARFRRGAKLSFELGTSTRPRDWASNASLPVDPVLQAPTVRLRTARKVAVRPRWHWSWQFSKFVNRLFAGPRAFLDTPDIKDPLKGKGRGFL